MTLGEMRVRAKFNPGGSTIVDEIKKQAADFIDFCASLDPPIDPDKDVGDPVDEMKEREFKRLVALAQTHAEDAAMWAVKAATME